MKRVRLIPVLMIDNGRAVVTRRFSRPVYVGDPLNTIRIFNDKEVDELFILDITREKNRRPDFKLIARMASESFMPLGYGGHISTMEDVETIVSAGIEKVSFNTALFSKPDLVRKVASRYGKQSVVGSIDYVHTFFGQRKIRSNRNTQSVSGRFVDNIKKIVSLGVGEILLNSIDRDGSFSGYDLPTIAIVSEAVDIPVVSCGGASSLGDVVKAIGSGASAAAAGAMFYFKGSVDAVLINYPTQHQLTTRLYDLLH